VKLHETSLSKPAISPGREGPETAPLQPGPLRRVVFATMAAAGDASMIDDGNNGSSNIDKYADHQYACQDRAARGIS
jgi:hypothetical protein